MKGQGTDKHVHYNLKFHYIEGFLGIFAFSGQISMVRYTKDFVYRGSLNQGSTVCNYEIYHRAKYYLA